MIEDVMQTQPPIIQGQNSWWNRNWKWFLPVIIVGSIAMFVCFFAMVFTFVTGTMKSSGAYKQAVTTAHADTRVVDALGSPLKQGVFISGNINLNNSSGRANLSIPISGPKGKGTIYVVAIKTAGAWNFSKLLVQIEATSEKIDLNTSKINL
jgi:hypothetical protein